MGQTLSEPVTTKTTTHDRNSRIIYGESCMQGWRLTMEDAHVCLMKIPDQDKEISLFCVFDGHGGQKVANYSSSRIAQVLSQQEAFKQGNYKDALSQTYFDLDDHMRKLIPSVIDDNSGATAVSCLITENKLYCANAGDSRCIISVAGKAVPMSIDHKPTLKEEQDRIIAAGGFVDFGRVNGNLALSRALGDFEFKNNANVSAPAQVVTAKPDLTEHDLSENVLFCVLACDGIWDCMSNQEVVDFIQTRIAEKKPLHTICEEIIDFCLAPDAFLGAVGCDNMSIIIIGFLNGKTEEEWIGRCKETVLNPSPVAPTNQKGLGDDEAK